MQCLKRGIIFFKSQIWKFFLLHRAEWFSFFIERNTFQCSQKAIIFIFSREEYFSIINFFVVHRGNTLNLFTESNTFQCSNIGVFFLFIEGNTFFYHRREYFSLFTEGNTFTVCSAGYFFCTQKGILFFFIFTYVNNFSFSFQRGILFII